MGRPIRIRNLAREVGVEPDEVILWLIDRGEDVTHAADFVAAEAADAVRAAFDGAAGAAGRKGAKAGTERWCRTCRGAAPASQSEAISVIEDAALCDRCGGSANRRAAALLIEVCERAGTRRLLVVGGGPGTAEELLRLLEPALEVHVIDGTAHRNYAAAKADLAWADVAAIWGGTILAHKVSKLYTDQRGEHGGKMVTVTRRSVSALCEAVAAKLAGV